MELKVYQIGLHDIGRYGFENLVELTNYFSQVDVELSGVFDKDFEKLENAKKFAKANGIELETFQDLDEMYRQAERNDCNVMIYDAGTVYSRSDNIHRSLEKGFFHLAEKPASLTRKEHLNEKKLAENHGLMWKVDFIERENPVVKKTLEMVEGEDIEEIKVFRESSIGLEKVLDPEKKMNVKGGDIFDKMINEIYVLDFLDAADQDIEMELNSAENKYFLPNDLESNGLMSVKGSKTKNIKKASTANTSAVFEAGETSIKLSSSWTGLTRDSMLEAKRIADNTGHKVYERGYSELDDETYRKEEATFFVIEGSINLAGDLKNKKLYNLDTGESIDTPSLIHDQLYRVLEKAVKNASGETEKESLSEETDIFMNCLFDVKEKVSKGKVSDEASKSRKKLETLIIRDRKIIDSDDKGAIAG